MNITGEDTNTFFQWSNPAPAEVIEKRTLIFREASLGHKKFRIESHEDKVARFQYVFTNFLQV